MIHQSKAKYLGLLITLASLSACSSSTQFLRAAKSKEPAITYNLESDPSNTGTETLPESTEEAELPLRDLYRLGFAAGLQQGFVGTDYSAGNQIFYVHLCQYFGKIDLAYSERMEAASLEALSNLLMRFTSDPRSKVDEIGQITGSPCEEQL